MKDKIRKVNWDLTPELHCDDGRQYGGAVKFIFLRDVLEKIEELKESIGQDNEAPISLHLGTRQYLTQMIDKIFALQDNGEKKR